MKKAIWIVLVFVIAGYLINSYLTNEKKREEEQAENTRIEKKIKDEISRFASESNAITDWEKILSKGEVVRSEPILTIELEKLWLRKRPILFLGSIKDISTYNKNNYIVLIERGYFSYSKYMFADDLRLSLICKKDVIDTLLSNKPDLFKDSGLYNNIAVTAHLDSIETKEIPNDEGDTDDIKIGDGKLIDIKYLGNIIF